LNIILQTLTEELEENMKTTHIKLNNKIQGLRNKQTDLQQKYQKTNTFHKIIENIINMVFTNDDVQLLNKGLNYILYSKKNWIKTVAIEADTTISQLREAEQMYMRQIVANNL
jgi:hypothetical protein